MEEVPIRSPTKPLSGIASRLQVWLPPQLLKGIRGGNAVKFESIARHKALRLSVVLSSDHVRDFPTSPHFRSASTAGRSRRYWRRLSFAQALVDESSIRLTTNYQAQR